MAIIDLTLPNGETIDYEHPDGLSDAEIEKLIYSDFPEMRPEKKSQFDSYSDSLKSLLSNIVSAPGDVLKGVVETPESLYKMGKYAVQHPIKAATSLSSGPMEMVRSILNAPSTLSETLRQKGVNLYGVDPNRPISPNIAKPSYLEDLEKDEGAKMLSGASKYGSAAATGPLALLSTALTAIGSDDNPFSAALGLLSPSTALKGVKKASNLATSLKPSSLVARTIKTPESKMIEGARLASDTSLPIGQAFDSPFLKEVYETASQVPFSGEQTISDKFSQQLKDKASKAIESSAPETPINLKETVSKGIYEPILKKKELEKSLSVKSLEQEKSILDNKIKDLYKKPEELSADINKSTIEKLSEKQKNLDVKRKEIYDKRNDAAESGKFRIKDAPDFKVYPSKIGRALKESLEPEQIKVLEYLSDPKNIKDRKQIQPSISQIQGLSSAIYDLGSNYKKSMSVPEKSIGKQLHKLSGTIKGNLTENIDKYGSKKLKKAQSEADTFYKEEYAPVKTKFVNNMLTNPEKGQSILYHAVGDKDITSRIKNLETLVPGSSNLVGYNKLKSAFDSNGKLDPVKAQKIVSSVKPRQRELIFSKDLLSNLEKLNKSNTIKQKQSIIDKFDTQYEAANEAQRNKVYKTVSKDDFSNKIAKELIEPSAIYDNTSMIKEVLSLLPNESKKQLGYDYLKNAFDEKKGLTPKHLTNLLESMGKEQTKLVFPDKKIIDAIKDVSKLEKMSDTKSKPSDLKKLIGGVSILPSMGLSIPISKIIVNNMTSSNFRNKVLAEKIYQNYTKSLSKDPILKPPKPKDIKVPVLTDKKKEEEK